MKVTNSKVVKCAAIAAVFVLAPMSAIAGGAIVSSGKAMATNVGVERYGKIKGHAHMIRKLPGETGITDVSLRVKGLFPNQTYPVHVHNASCKTGGGGHYQNEVGGAVDDINEIWLTFTTNSMGKGSNKADHGHLAREDARSIIIHDYTDKARIACIDLN